MSTFPHSAAVRFNFGNFPILETERLVLREVVLTDTAAVFRIRGDFEVTRLNIGAAYESVTQAADLIEAMARRYEEHREVRWGITRKNAPDEVIGMCGYNSWHQIDRRASLGFDLARAHWRQGIMREALAAIIGFGFTAMDLNRIEADASAENAASVALLKRLGFTHEGTQRDQYFDDGAFHSLELFGLLRREWQAIHP